MFLFEESWDTHEKIFWKFHKDWTWFGWYVVDIKMFVYLFFKNCLWISTWIFPELFFVNIGLDLTKIKMLVCLFVCFFVHLFVCWWSESSWDTNMMIFLKFFKRSDIICWYIVNLKMFVCLFALFSFCFFMKSSRDTHI